MHGSGHPTEVGAIPIERVPYPHRGEHLPHHHRCRVELESRQRDRDGALREITTFTSS
jgi:hypothetical protein